MLLTSTSLAKGSDVAGDIPRMHTSKHEDAEKRTIVSSWYGLRGSLAIVDPNRRRFAMILIFYCDIIAPHAAPLVLWLWRRQPSMFCFGDMILDGERRE